MKPVEHSGEVSSDWYGNVLTEYTEVRTMICRSVGRKGSKQKSPKIRNDVKRIRTLEMRVPQNECTNREKKTKLVDDT